LKTAFVIGSGIAGLSIAEILSRNGFKVVILESQMKIGGEASLATQKWYHTGWLYSALPNKAAMMGCYNALCLYQMIYGNMFSETIVNLDIDDGGIHYSDSQCGWFYNERIIYLFSISTYEMSLMSKLFWPVYLNVVPFRRLKNLNYDLTRINKFDDELKELMNRWEGSNNGYRRYRVIRSTDAKIDTRRVTKSLVSLLSLNTEIITNAKFKLTENKSQTEIEIDGVRYKPDILVLASGRAVPNHLREIGYHPLADKIVSIKSPILVLKKEIPYPDLIRFTPKVDHTINHIKVNVADGKQVSTVGSYYSFPSDAEVHIKQYKDAMCERIGITNENVLGSYFGIKTEFVDGAKRRYNHALKKVNTNTFIALAGKFSQFPLLVYDFVQKIGLSLNDNKKVGRIEVSPDLFEETYPARLINNSNKSMFL